MLKAKYKPFMDLMKQTYNIIYSEEKDGFTHQDAIVLGVFSISLDSLCDEFNKEIEED